jgi:hypothetical protein
MIVLDVPKDFETGVVWMRRLWRRRHAGEVATERFTCVRQCFSLNATSQSDAWLQSPAVAVSSNIARLRIMAYCLATRRAEFLPAL